MVEYLGPCLIRLISTVVCTKPIGFPVGYPFIIYLFFEPPIYHLSCGFESTVIGTLFCSETLYSGQWTVHSVRCIQPTVFFFHTKSAPVSSYQPANINFLSQQISTSHGTANRVVVMRSGENLLDSCWFVQGCV